MEPFYFYSASNTPIAQGDLEAFQKVFGKERTSDLIADVPQGSLVIPRFRAIPYGQELEREFARKKCTLINSFKEHRRIADLFSWVNDLGELTAPAFMIDDIPNLPQGEYFVKGETNSIKNNWFESAYARNKKDLVSVVRNVLNDQYVGHQKIVIRPFQNFRKLGEAVDGRPIFHERRVFILDGQILTEGFYWSNFSEEYGSVMPLDERLYRETLSRAIEKISHVARFIVIDLAEYPDGSWSVVELNDGCMSGLSDNDPETLWANFKRIIDLKLG